MEGKSHLSDSEMMDFETEIMKDSGDSDENEELLLTDDSDDNSINPGPLALGKNVLVNGNGNGHLTDDDDD